MAKGWVIFLEVKEVQEITDEKEEIYLTQHLSKHSRNLPLNPKTKRQFDCLIKILRQAKQKLGRGAVDVARGIG